MNDDAILDDMWDWNQCQAFAYRWSRSQCSARLSNWWRRVVPHEPAPWTWVPHHPLSGGS